MNPDEHQIFSELYMFQLLSNLQTSTDDDQYRQTAGTVLHYINPNSTMKKIIENGIYNGHLSVSPILDQWISKKLVQPSL